ncbi:C1 family peptidase [Prevotella sp. S7 MS 2]|uniref:C1 family peptidase n=1 Tax=Prevotella sp. S7 MS 2 TaxID=1287488 RepID=UPI00051445BA|nr:C1 family peptidase [Prevotella sp. S7 MS 2]KGI60355.1 cysteine protease [Prevotella sp. S7 MS 2]
MRKYLFYIAIAVVLAGCSRPVKTEQERSLFVNDVVIKTTPVKNQGSGQLCWAYAMLATIESEHLMRGDSVNLSTAFITRMRLQQMARARYLSQGASTFSLRGMAPLLIDMLVTVGAEPYDSYEDKDGLNVAVLSRKVARLADMSASRRIGIDNMTEQLDNMLDRAMGYMPSRYVHMLGAEYTPLEFAHSVCGRDEYVSFTSFAHHPWGEEVALELPDNTQGFRFHNLPIDELMKRIRKTLAEGHPVCWEGDISEPGFDFKQGVAEVDEHDRKATDIRRLSDLQHFLTTDDHCMELVGLARDLQGHRYFIAKNSWGTHNKYGGFMYLSEDYVRLKTVAVVMPRTE